MAQKSNKWASVRGTNRAAGQVLEAPIRPKALTLRLSTGKDPVLMVPDRTGHARVASPKPTSLYLYYDVDGILIYLGITGRGMGRNREHNARAEWWPFVASQEVEHFASRAEAEAQEQRLIKLYHPPFNKQHNPYHEQVRAEYLAFADRAAIDPLTMFNTNNRRLPVLVLNQTDKRLLLATNLEHAPVSRLIREYRTTDRVRVAGHAAEVESLSHHPGRALITVRINTLRFPPVGAASIGIKGDTQKPLGFRLAALHVSPAANPTVSVVAR